jgi:hypothetical protein
MLKFRSDGKRVSPACNGRVVALVNCRKDMALLLSVIVDLLDIICLVVGKAKTL